jgi:DNA uptake protein ComE-like DNA-binding protein
LALFGLLVVLFALSMWPTVQPDGAVLDAASVRRGVDPNSAPWWELTSLPEVGESTARRIIAYRDAHADRAPVFRSPLDLEPVPDIGPKTIQRIARHLRFDE